MPDDLCQMIQTDESGGAVLGQNDGITCLPVLAALEPRGAILILVQYRFSLLQHVVNKGPGVGADRIVDSAFQLSQFRRIDIDDSFVSSARELTRIPTHQSRVKTNSDHQNAVGVLQGEVRSTRRNRAWSADE